MPQYCPQCGSVLGKRGFGGSKTETRCGRCGFLAATDAPRSAPAATEFSKNTSPADNSKTTDSVSALGPLLPNSEPPRGIRIEQANGSLRLTRRWFRFGYAVMLAVCAGVDAFVFIWYVLLLSSSNPAEQQTVDFLMLVGSVPLVAGAVLSYIALAGVMNRSVLLLERERVTLTHGPLRWAGDGTWPRVEFTGFTVQQRERRSSHGVVVTFDVMAQRTAGGPIALLKGLPNELQACFIVQTLAQWRGADPTPLQPAQRTNASIA